MPHRIRLRRPWRRSVIGRPDEVMTVDVPDRDNTDQRSTDFGGYAYRRKFNRPSGLAVDDRVFLDVGSCPGDLRCVELNGQGISFLGGDPVDITMDLQPHNEILIEVASDGAHPAVLAGEVALVIVANR